MISPCSTEVLDVAGTDAAADALVDLMGQVAHDLNNQLATILGKSEIAMMVNDPDRWKSAVEESHKAGQRARVLVADFQRLHGWFRDVQPAPLSDVVGLLRRLCERRLSRSEVILEPAHAPSRVVREPVDLFLILWLVVVEALERGGSDIEATWTLTGREEAEGGAWSLQLVHPGSTWDPSTRELGPGADAPRRLALARALAERVGADLTFGAEWVLLRLSR